jgi:excisionase family DNA binding protein
VRTNDLPSELWDTEHLAAYLGLTKEGVYNLTETKQIRFYRVGRGLRFDPLDVAAFLKRRADGFEAPAKTAAAKRGRPRTYRPKAA